MVTDFLFEKAVHFSAVLREISYRPIPEYNERLARQYRYVSPRKHALIKHTSPAFGSPKIKVPTQNTLKIKAGLCVCWSVWCVMAVLVWHALKNSRVYVQNVPVCTSRSFSLIMRAAPAAAFASYLFAA